MARVISQWFSSIAGQSERTLLLGAVLVLSAVSGATGFFLAHYYSVDVFSSLIIFLPADCYLDWGLNVGGHCFSDYAIPAAVGMRPNPWVPYPLYLPPDFKAMGSLYPAAGMMPQVMFGLLGKFLGAPRIGLLSYLLALTTAVLSPAAWAARGARGVERFVVFVSCGVAAVPVWVMIDRGNSVGFAVPIALVFLVALCRRRWSLGAVMVVLIALVKPQFAVLVVALFAARKWRLGSVAVAGIAFSNLAAYVFWPRDFPQTIPQSIRAVLGYGGGSMQAAEVANSNVSLGKALLAIPDAIKAAQTGGKIPDDFLSGARSLIGYAVVLIVVSVVIALGRRIPPVMAGIVLLATGSLFPALSNPYYLFFVLPLAALVVRDPYGPLGTGIFDRPEVVGGRRRAVGVCVSLAAALCIAQIAIPGPIQEVGGEAYTRSDEKVLVVASTLSLAPILWLITLVVILVSYARRPAVGVA
ncbi:hypothetical protein [Mycobacterium sp.]|uniref:hypothetical protein n=1 Tax=Mycobacterium sp. TaxID=1785 RepID=UPI003A8B65AE